MMSNFKVGAMTRKPVHLVCLKGDSKIGSGLEYYLTQDRPELLNGFVNIKGFSVFQEDLNLKDYKDLVDQTSKDKYEEMLIPVYRIHYIKNLDFRGQKRVSGVAEGSDEK